MDTKKMLGKVSEAENLILTSDNRWFVGGSDGLYEVDSNGVKPPQKIPVAFDSDSAPSTDNRVFFLGITQHSYYVYASCTPDLHDPASPRYIMFMDTRETPARMKTIHVMFNAGIFNGLAADTVGNLYLTDFGRVLPPTSGKLVKLHLSSPVTVANQSNWFTARGAHPNGIKIDADIIYFTQEPLLFVVGRSRVKKIRIKPDGTVGTSDTLFTARSGRVLDDLDLVEGGLIITQASVLNSRNSRSNKVIHINESGEVLHASEVPFSLPSAVKLVPDSDPVSHSRDLMVTERSGIVSRFSQGWRLKPRYGLATGERR